MFDRVRRWSKEGLCVSIALIPISLTASALLTGCGAWVLPAASNDSSPATFGYTGSRLVSTVVPQAQSGTVSSAYFGMTIHRLVPNPMTPKPPVPFPAFPIHTFRFWDVVNWTVLEPASGQYDWTTMDNAIAVAKQNGVSDFIFTLGSVPSWASTNPADSCGTGFPQGSCAAPDRNAFDDFMAHVVQRYCGVVQYYETWNEPNLEEFWDGTNGQLFAIARDLNQIAKDPMNCGCTGGVCAPGGGINPNRVLLPSINCTDDACLQWLDSYLSAAGAPYLCADIAAFHGYGYAQPEGIVQGVARLQQTLAKHGLADLELWDTEASWGTTATDDQELEASWLMRFHIAQKAAGVSRFVWYAYDNCAWGTLWGPACGDSSDGWQGLRLPGQAYANLEAWTVGATLTHCENYEDGFWACELQRSGGYDGWLLWSSTGADLSVPIPDRLHLTRFRDWRNGISPLTDHITVGQMPVLLEN